jgi:hypothetical protein
MFIATENTTQRITFYNKKTDRRDDHSDCTLYGMDLRALFCWD